MFKKLLLGNITILSMLFIPTVYANELSSVEKIIALNPSITEIHQDLIEHKFTCKELINGYVNRIKSYNLSVETNRAPLNAVTYINPNVYVDADQLDKKLSTEKTSLPQLFCVPVIVKDNIDVKGMRTSVGSLSLLGTYPVADATVIDNIKHKGGIIIAKSSMNELAAGIDGVSGLSGRIGNAYNPDYTSGGSSGGSAVSVAAGFAPVSIGSDNSGSIRIPAAFNGIYGLRPTYGLISVNGVFPMGNLDGTIGPMASNVENLARLLTVMVNNSTNYEKSLNANSLRMKRFAVVRSVAGRSLWNDMSKPVNEIYKKAFNNMRSAGVVIVDIDLPKFNLDRTYNMDGTLDDVHQYLLHNISSISQLQDVCYGNSRVFGKPSQCTKFLGSVKAKNGPEYQAVKQMIASNQRYIEKLMKEEHLDGLVFTSGKSGIADSDWHKIGDVFVISSNSGLPEITLPVGQSNGLPVGMEILGMQNSDGNLLNYAYAYQQHFYKFKAPKLVADYSFDHWTLQQLNLLYPFIGMTSFNDVIKIENKNVVDAKQSILATKKAVAKAKLY